MRSTYGDDLKLMLGFEQVIARIIWALISASGLASFPVLAGIECLWIAVDNDRPDQHGRQAGIEAALACSKRWTAAGREVYRITPNRIGRDLNDVMRNRAAS